MSRCLAPRCSSSPEVGAVFCAAHLRAPAVQRGGWLSAAKRARARGGEQPIDASNIVKRLWVGGRPPFDRDLPGFDVLALCAEELQPAQLAFHGHVVRAPLPDSQLDNTQMRTALIAAGHIARHLHDGRRVLVTCYAGWNRSAFVASLALSSLTRITPAQVIDLMRRRRSPNALSNQHFCGYIERFVGSRRR